MPKVTVLMPVFNGGRYLDEAIRSVLDQSFRDFTFLIIDDGSTDDSAAIVEGYRDPRIQLVRNDRNLKLIATLNKGLELATGEYLARMDCDDISAPQRLARQVAFLDAHPSVGVCGTWFRKFGSSNKVVRWQSDPERIRCGLLFDAMVAHPTVMLRRQLFLDHALRYDPAFKDAEDFDLWVRALDHCAFANIEEVLLRYRVHPAQITQSQSQGQRETAGKVRLRQLQRMGLDPSPEEFEVHQAVSTCVPAAREDFLETADAWLCRLKEFNDRVKSYREPAFSEVLAERWVVLCKKGIERGVRPTATLLNPRILKATGLGRAFLLKYLARQTVAALGRV